VSAADQPDIAEAARASNLDIPSLLDRVEQSVLGGPRKYTPAQVAERAGVSRDESRALWRALGFPTVDDDAAVFTDRDVEALTLVRELRACGFEDDALVSAMTRLFGQTFSRLASWQGQLMIEMLSQRPDLIASEDSVVEVIEHVGPVMERLQNYAWRRQLVAFFARVAARTGDDVAEPLASPLAIGFADMSGFTSLTRKVSEAELRDLLDRFESFATDIVGQNNGRLVKTIGDEVLFQTEDPATAAEVALQLVEAAAADPGLPDLRAGLAYGEVVSRLGDVYGSTVNIASRLTSLARPGWVLVDRRMHDALADDARFRLKSRRPESVRGFHHLHPWRLRRSERPTGAGTLGH
jgi:adenylate cyclase